MHKRTRSVRGYQTDKEEKPDLDPFHLLQLLKEMGPERFV